jgi:hypothetical protein
LPEQERTLHRFVSMPERFGIQGKDPEMGAMLPTATAALKGSGNSYPTPVILAGLAPLLTAIADAGGHVKPCTL